MIVSLLMKWCGLFADNCGFRVDVDCDCVVDYGWVGLVASLILYGACFAC